MNLDLCFIYTFFSILTWWIWRIMVGWVASYPLVSFGPGSDSCVCPTMLRYYVDIHHPLDLSTLSKMSQFPWVLPPQENDAGRQYFDRPIKGITFLENLKELSKNHSAHQKVGGLQSWPLKWLFFQRWVTSRSVFQEVIYFEKSDYRMGIVGWSYSLAMGPRDNIRIWWSDIQSNLLTTCLLLSSLKHPSQVLIYNLSVKLFKSRVLWCNVDILIRFHWIRNCKFKISSNICN